MNYNDILTESIDELSSDENESLINLALLTAVVSNDIKHIHLHIRGRKFDTIHSITDSYYKTLSDDVDYLCELALEKNESMPNLNDSLGLLNSTSKIYDEQVEESYDYLQALDAINYSISQLITGMKFVRSVTDDEDIQSYLDDRIRYWNKEIKFKNNRRFFE
jgi:DNA-binding ferritin-like protein